MCWNRAGFPPQKLLLSFSSGPSSWRFRGCCWPFLWGGCRCVWPVASLDLPLRSHEGWVLQLQFLALAGLFVQCLYREQKQWEEKTRVGITVMTFLEKLRRQKALIPGDCLEKLLNWLAYKRCSTSKSFPWIGHNPMVEGMGAARAVPGAEAGLTCWPE